MTILRIAESFKTMNWIDPTIKLFDGLFLGNDIKKGTLKFCYNLHSSLQFVFSKFGIDIFDSLETIRFSATLQYQ